jgi:hypothetical protein
MFLRGWLRRISHRSALRTGQRPVRKPTQRLQLEALEARDVPSLLGDPLFPADNPWNEKITNAPVAANSAGIMNNILSHGNGQLHPDFGQDYRTPSTALYGIPYNVVHGNAVPKVHVVIDAYPGESDLQDAPIPINAVIEGDLQTGPTVGVNNRGDSHLLVWDEDNNIAYEFYRASRPSENADGKWHADQESVWDMKKDSFRTPGFTSADAAGLPILPGLVRPDEGLPTSQGGQGVINHAIRFTLQNSLILNQYVYPASHTANPGNTNAAIMPPMGARFRLKASVDISQLSPEARVIAQAMKDYGLILADNGSNFYFSGSSYSVNGSNQLALTWDDNDIQNSVHGLKSLHYSDFEVVALTPSVAGLNLATGSPAGGTTVTISGLNFSGGAGQTQVFFGATAASSVTVLSDTQIVVTAPPHVAGLVDVTVKSPYGSSAITTADRFNYDPNVPPGNGPTPNQRYVSQIYLDLLQRSVDPTGLADWSRLLDQAMPRTQFVQLIERSLEYRTDVVQGLYRKVLGRGADPTGLTVWVNYLSQGNTADQLEAAILGSDEYYATAGGGTNTGFVQALYVLVLNRTVDTTGTQAWGQALAQNTPRSAVAAAILGSIEADTLEVQALYNQLLHRPAESAGLGTWVNALQRGLRREDLLAAIVSSDEYYALA